MSDIDRILGQGLTLLVSHLLLAKKLLLLLFLLFLDHSDLESIVEYISDQIGLRNNIFLQWCDLGDILWLWSLHVQERDEDADLKHIHEFLVKGLAYHIAEGQGLIVEYLNLMLSD